MVPLLPVAEVSAVEEAVPSEEADAEPELLEPVLPQAARLTIIEADSANARIFSCCLSPFTFASALCALPFHE